MLTFFYAALISTVIKFVYFQFINTAFLENMFQETMKTMELMKLPMNDASVSQVESMLKPATFSMIYVFTNLVMGTIVGIIMAAFVKKEKNGAWNLYQFIIQSPYSDRKKIIQKHIF